MQQICISGNVGKDAVLRKTQGGDDVLGFSVGVKQGWGERASTNWFRCSVWGKRAVTLEQYLRKGAKVFVQGEFSLGEYEGKPQLDVRVNEVDFVTNKGESTTQTGADAGGWVSSDDPLDGDFTPF